MGGISRVVSVVLKCFCFLCIIRNFQLFSLHHYRWGGLGRPGRKLSVDCLSFYHGGAKTMVVMERDKCEENELCVVVWVRCGLWEVAGQLCPYLFRKCFCCLWRETGCD